MSSKKLSRHDIKRPDEFVTFFSRVLGWVQDNIAVVASATAVILLVAFGAVAITQMSESTNQEADYRYGKAVTEFHTAQSLTGEARREALEASLQSLQDTFEKFKGSRAADYALVSIGQANFELGKYEQAASAFEQAVIKFEKDPSFRAMALVGAGKAYEGMISFDKALDAYQRANAIDGNPYSEVLRNDIGRLEVFQKQIENRRARAAAAAAAATQATGN